MNQEIQDKIKVASLAIKTLRQDISERDKVIVEQKELIEKLSSEKDEVQDKLNKIEKRAEATRIVEALIDKRQVDPGRRDELIEEIEKNSDLNKIEEFSKILKVGDDIGEIVREGSGKPLSSTDILLKGIIDAFKS